MNNNLVYLHTGSNLGDREKNLRIANQLIEAQIGNILSLSDLYETAAWGYTEQPAFINQALAVETHLSPNALIQTILSIELEMGRLRVGKWMERLIDIDILFYNQAIINEPDLIIPHPRMTERNFVLVPLQAIAPKLIHPILQKDVTQLLKDCTDELDVQVYTHHQPPFASLNLALRDIYAQEKG